MPDSRAPRDYAAIAASLSADGSREDRMRAVADALWEHLHPTGVSWCGFYLDQPGQPEDRRLILGPHRDKPACSPIGLHGACGQCLTTGGVFIISDVSELGEEYIACDPRDRSEIVVPCLDRNKKCRAVLDLDSQDLASFDQLDGIGLADVLSAAGLWIE